MKHPLCPLFRAGAAAPGAGYSLTKPIRKSPAWSRHVPAQRLIVPSFTAMLLWIVAGAIAFGQATAPAPVVMLDPVPVAHLYASFLLGVDHNDRLAEQHKGQGRNAELSWNFLQNELGFSDEEFAPIRATAHRLEGELKDIDARRQAVGVSRQTPHPLSPELLALRQQHDNDVANEVADLRRALGPHAAAKLDSYVRNHINHHPSATVEDRQKDSLIKYGLFLGFVIQNDRAAPEGRQAGGGNSSRLFASYQSQLHFTDAECALVSAAALRLDAKNKEIVARERPLLLAHNTSFPLSPELMALNQQREALIEKEVSDLQSTLGPDLSARLESYIRGRLHLNAAPTDLDSEETRVFDSSIAAQQNRRLGEKISPDYPIYSLQIDGMSMIGALLALGQQLRIPLGIRYLDNTAVQKPVSVHLPPSQGFAPHSFVVSNLGMALNAILAVDRNYTWRVKGTRSEITSNLPEDGSVVAKAPYGSPIEIDNRSAHADRKNLLNIPLDEFAIPKCTIEQASHHLQASLAAALHAGPQAAVIDSPPGSGMIMVGPLKLRHTTVAEVLDKLVAEEGNVAWVVQVPPQALDQLAPEGLWRIIDYDDPAFDQAIEAVKKNILRYPRPLPQTSSGTTNGAR